VRRRGSAIVLLFVCSAACSLPATTFEAYRAKAADAALEVVSQARTAILVAHLDGQDRLLSAAVAVQLRDAEKAAATAVAKFASVQPPDARADHLRTRILPLLERTTDTITRMRFEATRDDAAALLRSRSSLVDPADALEEWAESAA
jgi:hypothetical protein